MSGGRLILVRHGESQYNLENRFTGWADPPLTERGILEAQEAGARLRGVALNLAFCSTLLRSLESARLVLTTAGTGEIPLVIAAELKERHYGALEGLNKDEAIARFGREQVLLWRRSYDAVPPGGESMAHASARILPYFRTRILPEAYERSVLICAHGNTLRSLARELLTMDEATFRTFDIPTGSILTFELTAGSAPALVSQHLAPGTSPGGSLL